MQWYEKFKVGQRVKVVKKTGDWNYGIRNGWNLDGHMDNTIGKVYEIIRINNSLGYLLATGKQTGQDFWYPVESLEEINVKGRQLLFDFMSEAT